MTGLDAIEFETALLSIDRLAARRIFTEASAGCTPMELVDRLVVPVMEHIGSGWEQGRVALSQVYMGGRICEDLVESVLQPSAERPIRPSQPRLAIGVLEDSHVLGKRIVSEILRASGFALRDLGHGLSVKDVAAEAKESRVDVLLISVLMLRSALRVSDLRERLEDTGVRIAVGGAPFRFDAKLWEEVGADAVGRTASEAPGIVTRLGAR